MGLSETPLYFISRYKGYSVGRYRRYPLNWRLTRGYLKGIAGPIVIPLGHTELGMVEVDTGSRFIL